MTVDREKVIKGLEQTAARLQYGNLDNVTLGECEDVVFDALDLLREQEPLIAHDPRAICPNCKWSLYPKDHPNYCGNCGKKVKWDVQ